VVGEGGERYAQIAAADVAGNAEHEVGRQAEILV
jgi:hypothetical protein